MIELTPLQNKVFDKWLKKLGQYCNSTQMMPTVFDRHTIIIPWNKMIDLLWELLKEMNLKRKK